MQVKMPDGSVIEGREAQDIIEWLEKHREKERKERLVVLKETKKPKAVGQVFRRVCQNNHIFTVPAHEINDPCRICGGRMKLQ